MNTTPKTRTKVQVKFRLPVATHKALTAVAAHRGTSITEEINRALSAYVEVVKPKGATP